MISFTGSTRAGIDVAKRAAPTVKRVSQELGGKSPNVILDDADFAKAVPAASAHVFNNSGQSCNAPTRMLVPPSKMKEVRRSPKAVADKTKVGDPKAEGTTIGPWSIAIQWDKIQAPDQEGHRRGRDARRRRPGPARGRQQGLLCAPDRVRRRDQRHDDRPRGDLRAGARHPRRQGRSRSGQDRQRHALRPRRLRLRRHGRRAPTRVGRQIRAGNVNLNGVPNERTAPFGGYKQSGNGREWGKYGMEEFLEVKAIAGAS